MEKGSQSSQDAVLHCEGKYLSSKWDPGEAAGLVHSRLVKVAPSSRSKPWVEPTSRSSSFYGDNCSKENNIFNSCEIKTEIVLKMVNKKRFYFPRGALQKRATLFRIRIAKLKEAARTSLEMTRARFRCFGRANKCLSYFKSFDWDCGMSGPSLTHITIDGRTGLTIIDFQTGPSQSWMS